MDKYLKSISTRLLGYVLIVSTVLTCLLVSIQLYLEFKTEQDRIEHSVIFIKKSFGRILASEIWNIDYSSLTNTLKGVLEVDYVERVRVLDPIVENTISVGELDPHIDYVIRKFPLFFEVGAQKQQVAILEVTFNLNQVYSLLAEKLGVIIVSNAIKTLIIIFSIFLIFEKALTRHLKKIAFYLREHEGTYPEDPLKLDREVTNGNSDDELGFLEKSLNSFIKKLADSEEKLRVEYQEKEAMQKKTLELAHYAGLAEMSSGIIHNLRNLITIVYMGALWVKDAVDKGMVQCDNPKFFSKVEKIFEAANVSKDIIKAQQDSANKKANKEMQKIKLHDFVESCIHLMDNTLNRYSIIVQNEVHVDIEVVSSPSEMVNILINLIKNSCEAMENQDFSTRKLIFRAEELLAVTKLSVVDTGCGVSPDRLPKIFEFGNTSKDEGHGFGLHSCRMQIRRLGGDLTIHSDGIGLGASVTIHLPKNPAKLTKEGNNVA